MNPTILKAVQEIETTGGKAMYAQAELNNPEDCQKGAKQVIADCGRIDGLINKAGVNDGVGLESGNYESFVASLHKNLVHYYLMAHYALTELKKSKGRIVNIGSKNCGYRTRKYFGLCRFEWRAQCINQRIGGRIIALWN